MMSERFNCLIASEPVLSDLHTYQTNKCEQIYLSKEKRAI